MGPTVIDGSINGSYCQNQMKRFFLSCHIDKIRIIVVKKRKHYLSFICFGKTSYAKCDRDRNLRTLNKTQRNSTKLSNPLLYYILYVIRFDCIRIFSLGPCVLTLLLKLGLKRTARDFILS